MKVLLLADVPGWILDRCVDHMIAYMPGVEFVKGFYGCMTTDEIVAKAADCDLIHYGNWDIERHWPGLKSAGKPVVMSVRSHRYPPYVKDVAREVAAVHVTNKDLALEFWGATVIPDGLMIEPKPMVVGFAGKPGPYKGTDLIAAACDKISAGFEIAETVPPHAMEAWFRGVDVYCCASIAEGHGGPVMEALAMNKPVVSTCVGTAWTEQLPGVIWVRRDVDSIAAGLMQCNPARHLDRFRWPNVAPQFVGLYERAIRDYSQR